VSLSDLATKFFKGSNTEKSLSELYGQAYVMSDADIKAAQASGYNPAIAGGPADPTYAVSAGYITGTSTAVPDSWVPVHTGTTTVIGVSGGYSSTWPVGYVNENVDSHVQKIFNAMMVEVEQHMRQGDGTAAAKAYANCFKDVRDYLTNKLERERLVAEKTKAMSELDVRLAEIKAKEEHTRHEAYKRVTGYTDPRNTFATVTETEDGKYKLL